MKSFFPKINKEPNTISNSPLVKFLTKLYEENLKVYTCCICLFKLEKAVNDKCGHVFCRKCVNVEKIYLNKCPICKKTLTLDYKTNVKINLELKLKEISCEHKNRGCQWKGVISTYNDHFIKCIINSLSSEVFNQDFQYNVKIISPNNGMFYGLLVRGKKFGLGLMDLSDENFYYGNFRNNNTHGFGQIISRFDEYAFYGYWKTNHVLEGIGYYLGKDYLFSGCVMMRRGYNKCQICWTDGHLYYGPANLNLRPDGFGILYNATKGTFYLGYFKDGVKYGFGFKFMLENYLGVDVCMKFHEFFDIFTLNDLKNIYKYTLKGNRIFMFLVIKYGKVSEVQIVPETEFPFKKLFDWDNNIKTLKLQRQNRVYFNPDYTYKDMLHKNYHNPTKLYKIFGSKRMSRKKLKPFIINHKRKTFKNDYNIEKLKIIKKQVGQNNYNNIFIQEDLKICDLTFEKDVKNVLASTCLKHFKKNYKVYNHCEVFPNYYSEKKRQKEDLKEPIYDIEVQSNQLVLNIKLDFKIQLLKYLKNMFGHVQCVKPNKKLDLETKKKIENRYIRIRPRSLGFYEKPKLDLDKIIFNPRGHPIDIRVIEEYKKKKIPINFS